MGVSITCGMGNKRTCQRELGHFASWEFIKWEEGVFPSFKLSRTNVSAENKLIYQAMALKTFMPICVRGISIQKQQDHLPDRAGWLSALITIWPQMLLFCLIALISFMVWATSTNLMSAFPSFPPAKKMLSSATQYPYLLLPLRRVLDLLDCSLGI